MVQQAMSGRSTACGAQLFCFTFLVLVLRILGCSSFSPEGYALLQFEANVDFDPSGALANWNPDDCSPCSWFGVHCLDGKVHMLDLNGRDLVGILVPELANLSHLRVLDLSKNHLSGTIPREFGQLTTLEVLDLRNNKLTGAVPPELGRLHSLKRLLLCNNSFEGRIPFEIGKHGLPSDGQCLNRKFGCCTWQSILERSEKSNPFQAPARGAILHYLNLYQLFKFGSESLHNQPDACDIDITESAVRWNVDDRTNQRRVLVEQSANLVALPPNAVPPVQLGSVVIPSRSSGSFPAVPNAKKRAPSSASSPPSVTQPTGGKSGHSLKHIIWLSILLLLLIVASIMLVVCRSRAAQTIRPWKTGLSGQLQKAFVTGVPKLNRPELETACEDFSNIIKAEDGIATVYKGTLSSGVEISVISTAIIALKDWSKRSETVFRKKIDTLSRLNHKNFSNLIGYCEEDDPFTRMMVFEYAPNGSLYEHLHVEELDHLDWNARTRIIMGAGYCLQHMHELNPPISHFNLTSKEILLTEDYAAKVADVGFWRELVTKSKNTAENESEHSELPPLADAETNVYSFGILMLETISGKLPYSEEQGLLMNWAGPLLNDRKNFSSLVDPALKSHKEKELEVICEVIQCCIQQDVHKRPSMREVIQMLRQEIDISPELATPRLSPLWWAELEILSAEAA
ncbi:protein MALE DISCOVERER 1-like isoform X1 [Salvia splendens]|uniref:protein MALE DISCOVERER 1-like isoform X1 n=2 Tax=Salvia splendens TaxID=180675 RepID=UPI0011015DE2|nr:protein MALE DISCOVERER 1-like isoform X1 [Salvia splendens]XP_042064445.1 protein MALE DISCOVERER 1-like isoform X1 [Salvia splendens]XP_042064446.1 protein MALE DISCOVERER 1-like isoform X1 [Salvia splendens]